MTAKRVHSIIANNYFSAPTPITRKKPCFSAGNKFAFTVDNESGGIVDYKGRRFRRNNGFNNKIRRMVQNTLPYMPEFTQSQNYEIGLEGLAQIMDSSRSFIGRVTWILVILVCFCICLFQFYKCVDKYILEPVAVDVKIREQEKLLFPSVTIANTESEGLYRLWNENSPNNESITSAGFAGCITPTKELVGHAKDLDTDYVWKALNTTSTLSVLHLESAECGFRIVLLKWKEKVIHKLFIPWPEIRLIRLEEDNFLYGKKYPVRLTEENGFFGLQIKIELDDVLRYGGVHTKYVCVIDKIQPQPNRDTCSATQVVGSLQPAGMPSDLRTTWAFTNGFWIEMIFTMQKYQFVSRRIEPCVDLERYRQCQAQCARKAFKDIPCRFPFVQKEVDLPHCITGKKNMTKMYGISLVTFARMTCSCPRLCEDSSFSVAINLAGYVENGTYLTAYFQSNVMTIINERFAYDIISLLSDIGGNLGLCLGFSILSIFQFLQGLGKIVLSRNSQKHKRLQPQQFHADPIIRQVTRILRVELAETQQSKPHSNESECPIVGFNTVINPTAPFILRILWFLVIVICFLGYCTFAYIRIMLYVSDPTTMEVKIVKADVVNFPTITICGYRIDGIKVLRKIAKSKKFPVWRYDSKQRPVHYWCSLQLTDMFIIPGLKADAMWDTMSCYEEYVKGQGIGEFTIGFSFLENVTFRPVYMPEGKCIEYSIGKQKYAGTNTIFSKLTSNTADGSLGEELIACDKFYYKIYITPPDTPLRLKTRLHFPRIQKTMILMEYKKITLLNLKRRPCTDPQTANECSGRCFEKVLLDRLTCRLPFMPNFTNLPDCKFEEDAKASYDAYIDFELKFDATTQPNCTCLPSCATNIINSILYFEPFDVAQMTLLGTLYFTNLQQHMIEANADSLSKLLCDLGGNLGLALGVSLLSIFDMIQSMISAFFLCLAGNRKSSSSRNKFKSGFMPQRKSDSINVIHLQSKELHGYTVMKTSSPDWYLQQPAAISYSKMVSLHKNYSYL